MYCVCLIVAVIFSLVGIVGCFVPVIPGPIVSFCGLVVLLPTGNGPSVIAVITYSIITVVVTVLDYIVPAIGAKRFNCSKYGTWGCTLGTFAGVLFMPLGVLFGPFLGAFVGELLARKPINDAALGGLGAFLGFLSGTFIKLIACVSMGICVLMHF